VKRQDRRVGGLRLTALANPHKRWPRHISDTGNVAKIPVSGGFLCRIYAAARPRLTPCRHRAAYASDAVKRASGKLGGDLDQFQIRSQCFNTSQPRLDTYRKSVFQAGHHRTCLLPRPRPPSSLSHEFGTRWRASRSGRSRAGRSTAMSAQDALLIVWGLALGMAVFIASPWRR
jgi:hypothetical protein